MPREAERGRDHGRDRDGPPREQRARGRVLGGEHAHGAGLRVHLREPGPRLQTRAREQRKVERGRRRDRAPADDREREEDRADGAPEPVGGGVAAPQRAERAPCAVLSRRDRNEASEGGLHA
jgi:hypothetical protein